MDLRLYSNPSLLGVEHGDSTTAHNAEPVTGQSASDARNYDTVTQVESLAYLGDMITELKDMASRSGFPHMERTLNLALELAEIERKILQQSSRRSGGS